MSGKMRPLPRLVIVAWMPYNSRDNLIDCPLFIRGGIGTLLFAKAHIPMKNAPHVEIFRAYGVNFARRSVGEPFDVSKHDDGFPRRLNEAKSRHFHTCRRQVVGKVTDMVLFFTSPSDSVKRPVNQLVRFNFLKKSHSAYLILNAFARKERI